MKQVCPRYDSRHDEEFGLELDVRIVEDLHCREHRLASLLNEFVSEGPEPSFPQCHVVSVLDSALLEALLPLRMKNVSSVRLRPATQPGKCWAAPHYGKRQASLLCLSGRFCGSAATKTKHFYKPHYMCYIYHSMAKPCNTQQAASAVDISVMTLQRWLAAGKVKGPKLRIRNGRAVRLWGKADLARLRKVKRLVYGKGKGPR
jgi:MerR HTH family regulatory protein